MEINLITPEEYNSLLEIQMNHPTLTFQNKGYEYINKKDLTDADKKAIEDIEIILRKSIRRFSSFTNFKLDNNNEVQIRLEYGYDASFTGVGYILLDELLNGFND